ncbi:hypothetical protein A9D12_13150 [Erythrobacter neustonensis]|uniref:Rap1a immunity protein domain-containing protein n=2 Tax=Erythrobacter neustonensis TaxID=1112 RepID=A0A192D5G6_9SPHN|nr:hypothetical protein A9D12_13150 [Erythrobacter neustonensis]
MRRALCLAASAGLLAVHPAAASAATAGENLDCAMWAAYRINDAQDDAERNALMIAMALFVGLYEGQTGKNVDEAMVARARELDESQFDVLEEPCSARLDSFADRLEALGRRLGASGH